jgi:hypothetical protein
MVRYLRETNGNVSAAARLAGIPRRTFYRMLERNCLNGSDFKPKDKDETIPRQ